VTEKTGVALLRSLIRETATGFFYKNTGKDPGGGNVRFGTHTTARRAGNILDDERAEFDRQKQDRQNLQAAVCLITAKDGKVLAVSRKNDPTDFGLPGGKVDELESPDAAAVRELKEETGLTATKLSQIFVRRDADGFTTTTFACEVTGEINTPEAGIVRWVKPEVLFTGSFGAYNKELFKRLGRAK